jgi:predicted ATPase
MPEMLRVKGDILARSGNLAEAENHLLGSLALSHKQCALGWELRGATSLGRIWHRAGRAGDARALIAPLLAQYQEGLSTRDLIAARDLLSALN